MDRLDKILSNLGYCTRKQSIEFLKDYEVTFDGRLLSDPSERVDAKKILIDNEPLDHPDGIFIILNKPAGYVCSHDMSDGRLVYELLPEQWLCRNPVPETVGRLDKDTTGVILITDNTKLVHILTSPKRGIGKTYKVTVDHPLTADLVDQFLSGTMLLVKEVKPCLPAVMTIIDETHAQVVLHEGRYHQIKRMFAHFGYTVTALNRSEFGEYTVDGIEEGTWKDLEMPVF
jgi:16S rRNA pseudouridine516 synthase